MNTTFILLLQSSVDPNLHLTYASDFEYQIRGITYFKTKPL